MSPTLPENSGPGATQLWLAPDAVTAVDGPAPAATPGGSGAATRDSWPAPSIRAARVGVPLLPPVAGPLDIRPGPATAPGRIDRPAVNGTRHTPDGIPKMTRPTQGRMLGGVAVGVARHLNVRTVWVRAIFSVLGAFAGAGVVAYALLWIFVPQSRGEGATEPTSRVERRQAIGIAALGVALTIAGTALGVGDWIGWVLGPLGLAVIGGAFIWREADEGRRARWRRTAAGFVAPSSGTWWRLVGGATLVVGGLLIFAVGQLDFGAIRTAVLAVILTLVGVGIITIPWWVRLVRDLGEERRGRIQEQERAEIAAHLHDSVLQTLALIQRQAGDQREVQRLARGQERELRSWLYGPAGYTTSVGLPTSTVTTLADALAAAVAEVEDTYAITVDLVMVGDVSMDPEIAALAAAARESMVNAAKHSGEQRISLYAEVEGPTVEIYVRDRGAGFDPTAVADDRRGLAESVHGRMARHGGTATVKSAPGDGTEVVLTMPVRATGGVDLVKASAAAENTAGPHTTGVAGRRQTGDSR